MDFGIISTDDHVVEAPGTWSERLPKRYQPIGPRLERRRITYQTDRSIRLDENGEWADVWFYEDSRVTTFLQSACAGMNGSDITFRPVLYEEMRSGYYVAADRLSDMDANGVDASMCFPNFFVRFAGQRFLEGRDKRLALLCVQAYNDWVVDEWCAASNGRLVPLCIVPLWDADLAAHEVRRNAARGVRAVSFSELPHALDLPSIHSGHWDPFVAACEETDTVINLHIGSGSKTFGTSLDAPNGVLGMLTFVSPAMALSDWLLSGYFVRYPKLTVAIAESNIGWIPYVLERADERWQEDRGFQPVWKAFDRPPSSYFASNMFCSFFNDRAGLLHIERVGVLNNFSFDNLTFETDYPHADGTWPRSHEVADELMDGLDLEIKKSLARENASRQLRLSWTL